MNTYLVDLHVHTAASPDGRSSLADLAAAAKRAGLDAMAICDHDLCTPVPEALEGVLLIPACEVSTRAGHITGLFLDRPLDLEALGRQIFSASVSSDKSVEELLNTDFKEFHIAGHDLGIGQITCLDTDAVLARLPELLPAMEKMKAQRHYDLQLLMLTDVLREGTELIFLGDEDVIRMAFDAQDINDHHVFLPHVVSRKKQIVPALALLWG